MTNTQIIDEVRDTLLQAGKIAEDELLHTFQMWKHLGYAVKKGEKAKACTRLWKLKRTASQSEIEDAESEEIDTSGRFFLAKSYLFSSSQVQPNSHH